MAKGSNEARNMYYVLSKAFNCLEASRLVNYDVTSYEFGVLPPVKVLDGNEKERVDLPFFFSPDSSIERDLDPTDVYLDILLCMMGLAVLPINAKYLRPSGLQGVAVLFVNSLIIVCTDHLALNRW